MKLIAEHINEVQHFERGQEPFKAMDIGQSAIDRKIIEETDWAVSYNGMKYVVKFIRDYKGFPILVQKFNFGNDDRSYIACSDNAINSKYYSTPEDCIDHVKKTIDFILKRKGLNRKPIRESVNFERGQDPFNAMNIGTFYSIHDFDYPEKLIDWVIDNMPKILKTTKIPDDIISPNNDNIIYPWEYFNKLKDYISKYVTIRGQHTAVDDISIGLLGKLKYMGYKTGFPMIDESVNFERGQDPIKGMNIGNQEALKQQAAKIDWDWKAEDWEWWNYWSHPSLKPKEEIVEIFNYNVNDKSFPIKLSKVISGKLEVRGYYAVSTTGEPYTYDGPDIFEKPEDAIKYVKSIIDEVS
jgi:hypothetical protein